MPVSGIGVGCIYGLIGIGFCVIYNASGIVNFAQGAFVMLGGMIAYSALTALGLPLAGRGRRRHRRGRGRRRHHRAPRGAAAVGPQGDDVRDDPGDARGADRGRAPDPDRRRRPAEDPAAVHRPAAAPARRRRHQLPVPLDRRRFAAADRRCSTCSSSGPGPARRCAPARSTARPRRCRASPSRACWRCPLRCQRGARRHRRHPDHADAIHRLQCRRAVCDLRLHRRHRRRLRPPARRLRGRHHAGAGAGDRHRRVRRRA